MDKRLCTLFSLLVLFWALPAGLSAQDCIRGIVYEDVNANGTYEDGTDLPLADILVIASTGGEEVSSQFTKPDGTYEICELANGVYTVDLGIDDQFYLLPDPLTVAGVPAENIDFPLIAQRNRTTLRGTAYMDLNDSGTQESDEPGLPGITVEIAGGDLPSPQILVTDSKGRYELRGVVRGDYTVSVTDTPPGVTLVSEPVVGVVATPGTSAVTNFQYVLAGGFGDLGGYICIDYDRDGTVLPTDNSGVGGHRVRLLDANGEELQTTLSCPDGLYAFSPVAVGSYRIVADPLPDYLIPTTPLEYEVDVLDREVLRRPFYGQPRRELFNCGMSLLTCFSGLSAPVNPNVGLVDPAAANATNDDFVVALVDTRNYPAAPSIPWAGAHPIYHAPQWTSGNMGQVFGLAFDNVNNAYVAATTTYGQFRPGSLPGAGPGTIYRISNAGGVVSVWANLPNATTTNGNILSGLGNICYDETFNVFYASNFHDGKIYQLDAGGAIIEAYDPPLDDPATVGQGFHDPAAPADFAPLGQRIWGVGVKNGTLYFTVWGQDRARPGGNNKLWSVDVSTGSFPGTLNANGDKFDGAVDERTLPGRNPVSDIAFDAAGTRIFMAEKTMAGDFNDYNPSWHFAHYSMGLSIDLSNLSGPIQDFFIGNHGPRTNSSGGLDVADAAYDPTVSQEPENCDELVWFTGDALVYQAGGGPYYYGLAGVPSSGNTVGSVPSTSIYIDIDNAANRGAKTVYGDVEVFDCECSEPNCADENGLEMLPSSPEEPNGVGDCCHILDYSNMGNIPVHAIDFTLLDGVQFQPGYQWDPGVDRVNHSSNSVTFVTPGLSGPLPNNINGLFNFCLENITAVPQFLVIDYRNADYEIFCTDTLEFRCPLQAECLEYVQDSLVCDTLGYKFTIDFEVPPGNEFDIGYIKMNLTQALPAGTSWMPIGAFADPPNSGHTFPTPLVPGDQVSLMYMITTMDDLFGDSLCILVTAHDDLEERLCCYAYEACIPYPDCPEPCEEVGARVVPSYQGDAATCCGGDPLEYEWLQDLIGDCTQRPCGAEVYCCELEDGTRVIRVAPDPAFPCADFPTELYGCDGTLIATSGGIAGGQLPPLVGCRKIYDCFEPDLNECCFDLLLTDTFTADPGLITAIQTTILNTGVTFSGQDRLGALLNGWTPTDLVPDRDILWNHSSGVTPNGVDQYLFSFCVEGTTSTDSVYVEVDFLNGRDSLICTDTVAVYCPYCLQIVNDSLTCVTDPLGNQTYLYEFSFVNSSAFDVNAVYISDEDTQALPDTVLNPGVHLLGSFVPPGATYTGTIPVEFDLGLDSACFDIVLRQIIGDSINISCCYATHCIELPPCDSLDQRQCPSRVVNDDIICLDVYEPVCGCDDVTYSNICYAERVGVITWTPGPCPNVNDPIDDVTLVGQPGDAGNQLNWTVNPPPADYAFFLVRKRDDTEGDYWTIADIPATDVLAYDFLHVNAAMGLTTYQILAVRSDGRVVASNTVELLRREMMGLRTTVYAYPSPAREELHVTVNRLGDATLELVSTDGQISQREHATFNGNPYTVDMSGLGNGVYIVRLRFDDGEIVQQRVVRVRE